MAKKTAPINPKGGRVNCVACVVAHILNQMLYNGEVVETAARIERRRVIDPVHHPLSQGAAMHYFADFGIRLSGRPVAFMAEAAPVGHYAIFLRRALRDGFTHVVYGRVEGPKRRTIYDPQSDETYRRGWAELHGDRGWLGEPYLVEAVER
jgi:hypothetical protein